MHACMCVGTQLSMRIHVRLEAWGSRWGLSLVTLPPYSKRQGLSTKPWTYQCGSPRCLFLGIPPPFSETGIAGRLAMTPWHLNGFQWSELQSSRVHVKRLTKEPSPQPAVWRKGCCTKQLWPIQLTPSFFLSKCQYFVNRMNCECVLISLITMKCPGAHGWKSRTHPQEAKAQMCQQFC